MFFTSQFWHALGEIDQTGECIAGMTFGRFLGEVGNPTLEVQDCLNSCPLDLLIQQP